MAQVPSGFYNGIQSRVQETVFLPAGSSCIFEIKDSLGDGLCCNVPGNYALILGQNPNGEALASGGANFGFSEIHNFELPLEWDDEEPIAGDNETLLTVLIKLDDYPHEIGWRVDQLGVEVEEVIRVPAGVYTLPRVTIVRTVVLKEGEVYYFKLFDILEDGIDGGVGKAFLEFSRI